MLLASLSASAAPTGAQQPIGAGGSPQVAFDGQSGPEWEPYARKLKRLVRRRWRIPDEARRGTSGAVRLHFFVTPRGEVQDLEVRRSTGPDVFVERCREAIAGRESRLPAPPKGTTDNVGVSWNFFYNLSAAERIAWVAESAREEAPSTTPAE